MIASGVYTVVLSSQIRLVLIVISSDVINVLLFSKEKHPHDVGLLAQGVCTCIHFLFKLFFFYAGLFVDAVFGRQQRDHGRKNDRSRQYGPFSFSFILHGVGCLVILLIARL